LERSWRIEKVQLDATIASIGDNHVQAVTKEQRLALFHAV
jgi:hypothetical protein